MRSIILERGEEQPFQTFEVKSSGTGWMARTLQMLVLLRSMTSLIAGLRGTPKPDGSTLGPGALSGGSSTAL